MCGHSCLPTPDKRTSAWKTTEKIIGKVHTFPLWERNRNGLFSAQGIAQAGAWAQQKMAEYGGELSSASARFLVEYVGGNPWNIAGECQKLALFQRILEKNNFRTHKSALYSDRRNGKFCLWKCRSKGDISEIIQLLNSSLRQREAWLQYLREIFSPHFAHFFLTHCGR